MIKLKDLLFTESIFPVSDKKDYIGGIYQGEVRSHPIKSGRVKYAIHREYDGLSSGMVNTNWRYYSDKNKLIFNLQPDEETIETVVDHLSKRGINNPQVGSMYKENLDERMTYKDLFSKTEPGRKERSSDVRISPMRITSENGLESWNFKYKSNPSTTGKRHTGSIIFYKSDINNETDDPELIECMVDCSCPDFFYKFSKNLADQDASKPEYKNLSKPQPAYDLNEQLCKHLCGLHSYLKFKLSKSAKQNLFEKLDEISQLPETNI